MKTLLTLLIIFLATVASADWCQYETTSGLVVAVSKAQQNPSGNISEAVCSDGVDIANPRIAWNNTSFVTATAQDIQNYTDAVTAYRKANAKQAFIDRMNETDGQLALEKAIVLNTLDQLNLLRQWIADFKSEVASATSLADFKSRVSTLPDLPQVSKSNALNTIKTRIGNVDAD